MISSPSPYCASSPPEMMQYEGRSLVLDPDVFSCGGDVLELLDMDMRGFHMSCRHRDSAVMLLDNKWFKHWNEKDLINGLIEQSLDYRVLMDLQYEWGTPTLPMAPWWNSRDYISPTTKFVHMTNRWTQPWRTGLPINMFVNKMKPMLGVIPREWVHKALGRKQVHQAHPDPMVEEFFFTQLRQAMNDGIIAEDFVLDEIEKGHIRPDALALCS